MINVEASTKFLIGSPHHQQAADELGCNNLIGEDDHLGAGGTSVRVGDGAAGFSIFRGCYWRQICRCKTDRSATSFIYPKGEQEEQKFKYWIMGIAGVIG